MGQCHLHGGSTPNGNKAAARQLAEMQAASLGVPLEVTPEAALLAEVHRSAGMVAWLQGVVAEMEAGDVAGMLPTEIQKGGTPETSFEKSAASVNVWVQLYRDERAHLARTSKMAIDAGIMERQVRIVEAMGARLVSVVEGVVRELGLDPQEPNVRDVMRKAFTSATTTAIEVEAK